MEIRKIYVDGFRNVVNTNINLDRISSIVGINNFGKSNLLQSIEFGKDFIDANDKLKNRMMKYTQAIPINNSTYDKNYLFRIEFSVDEEKNKVIAEYEYEFEWMKNEEERKSGAKICSEILKIKNENDKKYTVVMKREGNYFKYKTTEKTRLNKKHEILNNELAINKINKEKDIYYKNIVDTINDMKFEYDVFSSVTNAFNTIKINEDTEDSENKFIIDRDGDNICEIIYRLKEEYEHKYNILMDAYKKIIPSIEYINPICINPLQENKKIKNIPFKMPDKIYTINVKEKSNNQETPIKFISTGSKRILILLTAIIISDINKINLIMFEELENSIHPYLFQRLLVVLNQLAHNCKVIITSHSPYLIQYMDMDKIYIGVPNNENLASFKRVKNQYRKKIMNLARKQGITLGDYIFELLLESVYDNEELISLLEE